MLDLPDGSSVPFLVKHCEVAVRRRHCVMVLGEYVDILIDAADDGSRAKELHFVKPPQIFI